MESKEPIMSGNVSYYQWFIIQQKEQGVDYTSMMRELERGNPEYDILRKHFRFDPVVGHVVPAARCPHGDAALERRSGLDAASDPGKARCTAAACAGAGRLDPSR
jgi:hypothetical protein